MPTQSPKPPYALTAEQANAVYEVLVQHAGEHDNGHDRDDFIYHQTRGCREYRFVGSLGFGGKFWVDGGWRVSCYSEDRTPEREAAIKATNEALAALYEAALTTTDEETTRG